MREKGVKALAFHLEWLLNLNPKELLILNLFTVSIPLTIWLGFKVHKMIEKIKDRKS